MICKNCTTSFKGKFCFNCGQKSSVGELNLHDLFHEFWHAVTHTDRGILKLINDLSLHPKRVYLGYFSGQRKTYFSPVTFFLVSVTLLLLIGEKIYDYEDYYYRATNPHGINEFGRYAFAATKITTLFTLPFEIALTWLLFRKQYNLAKIIVFWIYFQGFIFTIQLLLSPLYFVLIEYKKSIDSIVIFSSYLLLFWHIAAVFGGQKWKRYVAAFCIVNFVYIISNLVTSYMLFESKIFEVTKTSGVFDLILHFYTS